ncbi:MAG TPA: M18 family aminopeptidase [Candidatus Cloacimonadota bacterium]|nr:M18 family aminopeptidase [Candidatus Cloacimonadota bacterium]HPS39271.1 M18 family aminopeptidase [Candidatus Cloacimonadota bacterium]
MNKYIEDLLSFLDNSPTSFQANTEIIDRLKGCGFNAIDESKPVTLQPGGKYYLSRFDTAVIAFVIGSDPLAESGFSLAASHIDSPLIKVKGQSVKSDKGISRVGTEIYGGPIISGWLDRELSLAGRIVVKNQDGTYSSHNVNLKRPVAIIPNAAIHLNRDLNKGYDYNKQTQLQAIISTDSIAGNPLLAAIAEELQLSPEQICDMDVFLYDPRPAQVIGFNHDMIASGRLDNLAMTHAILSAIMEVSEPRTTSVAVFYDHEEIGSRTPQGAMSSLLNEVLERISLGLGLSREDYYRALRNSYLVSADMAHAYHPNYPEKYDGDYVAVMNQGPVIKLNADFRYSSTADSSLRFVRACDKACVKYQRFLVRSDMPCGSTVGPLVASALGISAIDIGNPMWAMHSVRETAGVADHKALIKVLKTYYN